MPQPSFLDLTAKNHLLLLQDSPLDAFTLKKTCEVLILSKKKQVFNDTKLCNTTAVSLQQKEEQSLQGTNEERAHCSDHSCCFQLLPSSSPVCIL